MFEFPVDKKNWHVETEKINALQDFYVSRIHRNILMLKKDWGYVNFISFFCLFYFTSV